MTFRGGRKKPGREYTRYAREIILELLETRSLTAAQMARLCQRDLKSIYHLIGRMRKSKEIHITDWIVNEVGPHTTVWGLGNLPDEPPIPPMTQSERCKRYKAKLKPPVLVRRDRLLAALMGGCRDSTMAE